MHESVVHNRDTNEPEKHELQTSVWHKMKLAVPSEVGFLTLDGFQKQQT